VGTFNYFTKTFGINWKKKLVVISGAILLISFAPAILLRDHLLFVPSKFVEEWFKNCISLTILFLVANYLNYSVNFHRNRDRIYMLLIKLDKLSDFVLNKLDQNLILDIHEDIKIIERIVAKIQSEEEFFYAFMETESDEYKDYSRIFAKLYGINFNNATRAEINLTKNIISNLRTTFNSLNERILH
jgi:hypothetical protein